MGKIIFLIVLSVFSLLLSTYDAEATMVLTCEELLKDAEKYDGKTVIFQGEVIGDIMVRRNFAWINVRDKTGAIGVFCPKDLVSEIKYQGGYRYKGDIISVRGVFYRSCLQHGGDSDIHAENITIIQTGEQLTHPIEPQKLKTGIILPAIALLLLVVHLVIRRFR